MNNENELYELTSEALPKLAPIGEHDVVNLLSVRTYYGGNKDDFQMYDIKFININKINWDEINNFDDFLSKINMLN